MGRPVIRDWDCLEKGCENEGNEPENNDGTHDMDRRLEPLGNEDPSVKEQDREPNECYRQ